jgi:hypothetical protein
MPNVVMYLNDVYDMLMAFMNFWAGDKLAEVQKAVDHIVLTMEIYPRGLSNESLTNESRRLRGGGSSLDFEEVLQPHGNFMGGVQIQNTGQARWGSRRRLSGDTTYARDKAAKAPLNTAELGKNYTEVCPQQDPIFEDPKWRVPMIMVGNETHKKFKAYANTIDGSACPDPHVPCEPRSSPHPFGITVKMMLTDKNDSESKMGTFCLKDTVTHILESNGANVPDFCGDICDTLNGKCARKTVEQYFNKLKPEMLSDYYSELTCTTAPTASPTALPTASPTALPTQPFLATVPVLNFINQCNGFGPCSMSNDASTCYCVAASLEGMYTDEGAVCSDTLEGDVSNRVTVSEDHVDLSRTGTYLVRYNCTTAAGGIATPIVRTVTVFDAVCPTCEVTSHEATTIEASFPFVDHQVLCSDNMDLTPIPASTSGEVDVELTGKYIITYSATDGSHNTNFIRKYNDSVCNAGLSQKRTVLVIDTLAPVISLSDSRQIITPFTAAEEDMQSFSMGRGRRLSNDFDTTKLVSPTKLAVARHNEAYDVASDGASPYSLMKEAPTHYMLHIGVGVGVVGAAVALFVAHRRRS